MEEQRGEIDALMLDLWSDGLRVIINDKGGFRDMFDAKGYSYGNDSDAIKRFFRINMFCGRRKDKWLNA